jgi:hypothetical protein
MGYYDIRRNKEQNMKKTIFLCIVVFGVFIILSSCISYPKNLESKAKKTVVWDDTIPKEQSVCLYFLQIKVTNYNGVSVDWPPDTLVYLPPGDVNFIFDANIYIGNMTRQVRDALFEWKFGAGDDHILYPYSREGQSVIFIASRGEKFSTDATHYVIPVRTSPVILQ